METVPFASARDFADSPFPVTPVFDAASASWHDSYPPGIPPKIEYSPRRVEQLLQSAVERYPDRVAIRYFRTSHTYQELLDQIKQTAGALRELAVIESCWCFQTVPSLPSRGSLFTGWAPKPSPRIL